MNNAQTNIFPIEGFYIGHYTNLDDATGCTAIVCPEGATCSVDVRGGAPATRETDLLSPERTVQKAHCVLLSGGSAYGLAASDGAMEVLEGKNIGFDVGLGKVPIVPSACLFDLCCGSFDVRPGKEEGQIAVLNAFENASNPLQQGNIGAGTGCTVAKFAGFDHAMKGGLGIGYRKVDSLEVQAIVAVNACGDVINPKTGKTLCAAYLEDDGNCTFTKSNEILKQMQHKIPMNITNTTLGCVTTNAKLTQAECKRVAIMAHDGYANCIKPTHSPLDGDAIFVMSTDKVQSTVELIGTLAQEAIEDAIVNAAMQAKTLFGYKSCSDLNI